MKTKPRRAHGTGSLYPVVGSGGRETWYGRWYIGRKRVQRRIGPKRRRGDAAGLTKTEAEAELRHMRLATEEAPPPETTVTVDEAAEHLMGHLEAIGRRPTTLDTYWSLFRTHLQWSVEEVALERITRRDVEELDRVMRRKELAPKTRLNASSCSRRSLPTPNARAGVGETPASRFSSPRSSQHPTSGSSPKSSLSLCSRQSTLRRSCSGTRTGRCS
jgi:hypothetical protein